MKQDVRRLRVVVALSSGLVLLALVLGSGLVGVAEVNQADASSISDGGGFAPTGIGETSPMMSTAVLTTNCRYGVAGWDPYASWLAAQNTGVGWYIDYSSHDVSGSMPGAEYVQTIRIKQDRVNGVYLSSWTSSPTASDSGLGALVRRTKGALWLIGNEPDRGPNNLNDPNRVQDDTYPNVYAKAYHDLYHLIKANDPTAQVAVAGVVQVTPGRLQYYDRAMQAYQSLFGTPMPVDVWNIHIYVLAEANHDGTAPNDIASVARGTDLSLALRDGQHRVIGSSAQAYCNDDAYVCFRAHDDVYGLVSKNGLASQIVAMRTWMKARGQQNKPLIMTEFGILYRNDPEPTYPYCWVYDEWGNCFTRDRAANYLRNSFEYLNNARDPNIGFPADDNRLVQQWMWYSMNTYPWPGYLADVVDGSTNPMRLTVVGNALKTLGNDASKFPQNFNFAITSQQVQSVTPGAFGANVKVRVGVRNNGSIAPSVPLPVAAYADAALTQVIGYGTMTGVRGCARREYFTDVNMSFHTATPATVNYWLVVNPGNILGETSMAENIAQGSAQIPFSVVQTFLPLLMR